MKILLVSDITLKPVVKEIRRYDSTFTVDDIFVESIDLFLMSPVSLNEYDTCYIHIDCIFKKHTSHTLSHLLTNLNQFANTEDKPLIVSNLIISAFNHGSLTESSGYLDLHDTQLAEAIQTLKKNNNVIFHDTHKVVSSIGIRNAYNYNLGHLYQMPYTKLFISEISKSLSELLRRISQPDKKVIVIDCDNTLWGGIIGEDGLDGIKCDLEATGILYYHFQQFLIQKKSEGFLLAISSKNNESDVKDAFDRKHMPLNWDDFVVKKINWSDKAQNIAEIATTLNLGLESFIFVDDSEFEINSVKQLLPSVSSFHFSSEYESFLELTDNLIFRKKNILEEDLEKTTQYEQEYARKSLAQSFSSMEAYIDSLNINIEVRINSLSHLNRLSQLTEKTNQFNFNKKLYTPHELQRAITNGKFTVFSLEVDDRFGSYGVVGLIIVELSGESLILENFIMSCRALGRRIEYSFWDEVNRQLIAMYGKSIELIRFKKTKRNTPANQFLDTINISYESII